MPKKLNRALKSIFASKGVCQNPLSRPSFSIYFSAHKYQVAPIYLVLYLSLLLTMSFSFSWSQTLNAYLKPEFESLT